MSKIDIHFFFSSDEALRTFLSRFLALHRIRVVKLKRFIARWVPSLWSHFFLISPNFHSSLYVTSSFINALMYIKYYLPPSGTYRRQERGGSATHCPHREFFSWSKSELGWPRLQWSNWRECHKCSGLHSSTPWQISYVKVSRRSSSKP